MIAIKRYSGNPILFPNKEHSWESEATFNGSVVREKNRIHLVYRAMSSSQAYYGKDIELSSVGYAVSRDGIHFENRRILITPEYKWKQYGCEDPRVTYLNGKFYIVQ